MTKRVFWAAFVLLLVLCCVFTAACVRSLHELISFSEMVYVAPL
jgi:hypothetical protein